MKEPRNKQSLWSDNRGVALVTSVIFMGIMSMVASAFMLNASSEFKTCRNFKKEKAALYIAEAGSEEARARLKALGDTSETPSGAWRAFMGDGSAATDRFGYNAENANHNLSASLQNEFSYTVMIRHQTESDVNGDLNGDGDQDDILLWGDTDGDYIAEKNLTDGYPVEIVLSQGTFDGLEKQIISEVRMDSLFFDPPAALYVNGPLVKNGASGEAVGAYSSCDPVPDVVTTTAAWGFFQASNWPAGTSSPAWLVDGEANVYPISDVVDQACDHPDATPIFSGNNQTYGSVDDPNGIYCSNGSWAGNNLDGYGILVVKGHLITGGNISWHGIVLVDGIALFSGGGHQSIHGAVLANSVAVINGQPDIYYDCQVIEELSSHYSSYETHSWNDS